MGRQRGRDAHKDDSRKISKAAQRRRDAARHLVPRDIKQPAPHTPARRTSMLRTDVGVQPTREQVCANDSRALYSRQIHQVPQRRWDGARQLVARQVQIPVSSAYNATEGSSGDPNDQLEPTSGPTDQQTKRTNERTSETYSRLPRVPMASGMLPDSWLLPKMISLAPQRHSNIQWPSWCTAVRNGRALTQALSDTPWLGWSRRADFRTDPMNCAKPGTTRSELQTFANAPSPTRSHR